MRDSGWIIRVGFAILMSCVMWWSPAAEAVIVQAENPDAYTEKMYRLGLLDYHKRTMSQAYLQVGSRNPEWDALVVELLDAQAVEYTNAKAHSKSKVPGAVPEERILEIIDRLRVLGCDDPYVRYIILTHTSMKEEGYLDQALEISEALLDSDYPINRKRSFCWYFTDYFRDQGLEQESDELLQAWVDLICESVYDEGMSLDDQYYMFRPSTATIDRDRLDRWQAVCERIENDVVENHWLADCLVGFYHAESAWQIRRRYRTISERHKDWGGYLEHLRLAREHLEAAWESAPQYPISAYKLIEISVYESAGQERLWFERAINAQFDYFPAYTNYLWSVRPRWGGSVHQMYQFGVECLQTERFDTRVPALFYRAMYDIRDETDDYRFWLRDGVYENFMTYFEGRKNAPGEVDGPAWWDSMRVPIAWVCRRMPEAAAMVDEMGDEFNPRVFKKVYAVASVAVSEAYARSGPSKEAVDQGDQLWSRGHYREAARVLEEASAKLDADHPAQTYLSYYTTLAGRKHQDIRGEWVDLLGRPDLNGWGVYRGEWEADDQGRLIGTSDDKGMELKCWYNFGYKVEIEGTLTFLEVPEGQEANAGILFAYFWQSPHSYHNDFLVSRDRQSVVTMRHLYHERWERPAKIKKKNRFHLEIWKQHVRMTVNDQVVIDNWVVPRKLPGGDRPFAIGGRYKEAGAQVRFDELRAKRLTVRPAWAVDEPVHNLSMAVDP